MGKSSRNGGFSCTPCLIAGGCLCFGKGVVSSKGKRDGDGGWMMVFAKAG